MGRARVRVWHEAADTRLFRPPNARRRARAWCGSATGATASAPPRWRSFCCARDRRPACRSTFMACATRPRRWRCWRARRALPRLARQRQRARGFARHWRRCMCRGASMRAAARHSDHPRVRGAGLRHSAGLRALERQREAVHPGTDYLVAQRRRGDDRAPPRAARRSRSCAGRLRINGLASIRSRHSCAHRAQELLAILAHRLRRQRWRPHERSPSMVRACCRPTGTARPPITAGCCAIWRAAATTSPSTSPTPSTGRSTATSMRPTGPSRSSIPRRAEGLARVVAAAAGRCGGEGERRRRLRRRAARPASWRRTAGRAPDLLGRRCAGDARRDARRARSSAAERAAAARPGADLWRRAAGHRGL
jgi:hypothetical protein